LQERSRTIVITGATKGIGLAVAQRLVADGYQVVGIARTPPDHPFPGVFVRADLADEVATADAVLRIATKYECYGLINNVGLVGPGAVADVTLADFRAVFDLTLRPALQCAQALLPAMLRRRSGRIVNIASAAVVGVSLRTVYVGAKSALVGFTRTWALELAAAGITVNAVAPGPVETEFFRAHNPVGSEGERRYLTNVPMRRFGQPSELAGTLAFLMSDDAGYITGQTIFVDGGFSIGRVPA
jgi:NAD(P)-dependent dehydrogenase (short-subunit alcohol dehydrogenase family)